MVTRVVEEQSLLTLPRNAPDGWTAEQVNFIVNCQRRKYSYGRTHMEYMQRWPGKQLYTYQIQYIIWESVFEC
jgi:hypothetical protein